jgi:CDP-diacylglycerol---glycerol-3-phosphate 3-phosphatidyltransferase
MLDPIADKLLISATLVSLVQLNLAPAWMVTVIIGREFAVTGLRSVAYARGLTMPASSLGKLKMVSQVVAILLLILGWERMPLLLLAGQAALWVVLATALWSAVDYYHRFTVAMARISKVTDFESARARAKERRRA